MKRKLLVLGFIFFIFLSGWSQSTTTLDFRIVNPRIIYDLNNEMNGGSGGNCENLDFDLEVKANQAGSYLYALEIHLTTNMSAVTDLDFTLSSGWTNNYSSLTYNLNDNNINLSVANNQVPANGTINRYTQIPTEWKSVGTLRLRILDISLIENCSWIVDLMSGQQYEKYFTPSPGIRTFLGFNCEGTPISNLYLGRIYSAGTASWGWSQAGGTSAGTQYVDWTTAVNTSVWDIAANTPAEITSTGSKALGLRIHSGAQLQINADKDLTCTGETEINGAEALKISSNATGSGSFIDNGTITYPAPGSTARVERYLTACDVVSVPPQGCWHYVTSPITTALSGVFLGDYLKSWDETTGTWSEKIFSTTTPLNVMEGYIVNRPLANTDTKAFIGSLNTNCAPKSLTFHEGAGNGFNLVGNPYSAPIDLTSANITWTNVNAKVWFYSKYSKTYKPYVVGGPQETNPGTRYAPAMQGFFVQVPGAGTASLTIANGARTATHDTNFYKNSQSANDVLWLTATSPSGMTDETVVYFRPDATGAYDQPMDCEKLWGSENALQLYSKTTNNYNLTINALTYSGVNTMVPVAFTIFTPNASGNYSFTASKLETFRTGTTITLEDKKAQKTQVLTTNPVYNFTYTDGDAPDRFLLHFANPYYGISTPGSSTDLQIYSYDNSVYLKDNSGNPKQGEIFIYNMVGQVIAKHPVAGIQLNKYTFDLPTGYYVVRVITKDKTYNGRVYLH